MKTFLLISLVIFLSGCYTHLKYLDFEYTSYGNKKIDGLEILKNNDNIVMRVNSSESKELDAINSAIKLVGDK